MKACIFLLLLISFHFTSKAQNDEDAAYCISYFHTGLQKEVFRNPVISAGFKGGTQAYIRFINKNFRPPLDDLDFEDLLHAKVRMKFIVDSDGQMCFIELNGKKDSATFTLIEREVMRIMRLMPKWEPAICRGRKVPAEVDKQFLSCMLLRQE